MALIDEYSAAQNQPLVNKVQMAAIAFAIDIIQSEAANTDNHQNRSIYAKAVVNNPSAYAPFLTQGVVSLNNTSDPNSLTDTTINNSVAAIWNMYAGLV